MRTIPHYVQPLRLHCRSPEHFNAMLLRYYFVQSAVHHEQWSINQLDVLKIVESLFDHHPKA